MLRYCRWITRPQGVFAWPVTIHISDPSGSRKGCITSDLPKLVCPTISARSWSWSAPATSSEALAVPALIMSTRG